jgi:hypothetical protein
MLNLILLNVVAPIEAALDVYGENIFFVLLPAPSDFHAFGHKLLFCCLSALLTALPPLPQ